MTPNFNIICPIMTPGANANSVLILSRFQVLTKALKAVRGNRRELLAKILNGIHNKLREEKIEAGVFGWEKSLYSIYHKMVEKHLSFSQVLDIYGFRIIVNDTPTCYLALGALHSLYKRRQIGRASCRERV